MTATVAPIAAPARRLRGTRAVVIALVANVVVTLLVDQLFHVLGVYPPWGAPMFDTGDNLLALSYRLVIGVLGGWLCARLAPRTPMRFALVYGGVGFVISTIGAIVAISRGDLGPAWYPVLLALAAFPCAWIGGRLEHPRHTHR